MTGPWEKFSAPQGPWTKYAASAADASTFDDRFNAVSDEAAFRAVEPPKKTVGEAILDTWPARAVKSVYSAVTLPGDVAAGRAKLPSSDGSLPGSVPYGAPESAGERVADLAGIAAPVSVAAGTGRAIAQAAGVGKPVASIAKPVVPSVAELKQSAREGFQAPEVKSLEIKSPAMRSFAEQTKVKLNEAGIDDVLAPEVFTMLGRLEKAPEGAFVTGSNIQSLRRTFSKAAQSTDPTKRAAASQAIEELDNFLPTIADSQIQAGNLDAAVKTLNSARGDWRAAKLAENLDAKLVEAQLRAEANGSGMNLTAAIKQRMASIIADPRKRRGYSEETLGQMRDLVSGNGRANALRMGSNFLGGGGGLGAMVASGGGYAAAGPAGIALPGVGVAMRALSNKLTLKQAERISESVRANSPLASSMQKFEEKAAAFSNGRSARTLSDFRLAAKNLRSNLATIGINASLADLLKGE